MKPPPMKDRFACSFPDYGYYGSSESRNIDIVYWFDKDGYVMGEAYFHRNDVIAPIVKGEFYHPIYANHFRLHVPSQFGGKFSSKECLLDVLTWENLGRCIPKSGDPVVGPFNTITGE